MTVRVRFAPSPTGLLHVGGARTALFNYYFARRHGGQFVLRIEDTDTERSRKEWEEEILFSMKWLGLNWDEGPFYQTQRFDLYRSYVDQLLAKQEAYRCTCTAEELTSMRQEAEAQGRKPMYDRRCREKNIAHGSIDAQGQRKTPEGKPYVVRFKTPLSGEVIVSDLIHGEVRFSNVECDDFVILRSNNTPTYNFTVVVDDIDMRMTHVIRGDDHLNNTPKQMLIMKALGWTPPAYAHVPMILAPDKTKMSKRHGAVAVSQFRSEGYLPQAMANALIRLGWSHGDQEIFSAQDLREIFDLKGCGSSGAVFDIEKLKSLNAHYLKQMSLSDLVTEVKTVTQFDLGPLLLTESGQRLLQAFQERAVLLTDFSRLSAWYWTEDFSKDPELYETIVKGAVAGALESLTSELEKLPESEFRAPEIQQAFKAAAARISGKMPQVAKPARVLLTGTLQSPDIGIVVEALGKERSLARLRRG